MRLLRCYIVALSLIVPALCAQKTNAKPWPIRAVLVTTFEVGADTGDTPGEFQFWVEREHLDEVLPASPGGFHVLRTNKDHTVLGMLSGTTLVNATASMMALGLDSRFDLTHAYILINGIGGVDPHIASMGSAAWALDVVGDVAREIDPREAPKAWPYGIFPTTSKEPNPAVLTESWWNSSNLYPLNATLVAWAFAQTKDLNLGDDPKVADFRKLYTDMPNALRPPFVLVGDSFASDYYWHGRIMTQYAEDWVRIWTHSKGTFAMTDMEDSGFMEAIARLGMKGKNAAHKVDEDRVLVLRTGSNYCMPAPGHDAVESVSAPYIGGRLALESAYLVGSTVLHKLLGDWPQTRDHIPSE